MPPTPSPRSPAASAGKPAWQTAATVLLIVHLFCLAMGLIANASGGKSMLGPALRSIPLVSEYLQLTWMDVGYDFHLASPLPEDGTHRLRLSADPHATSPPKALPVELTDDAMQPRIRRQRYQQLAYHVAFFDELFAENSDLRTELPLAIAEQWIRELDLPHDPYVLTCIREPSKRLPKAIERAPSKPREGGPRMAGPATFEPVTITINLVWDEEESRYQGSRAEPEGQVSQVVRETDAAATDDGEAADDADQDDTQEDAE
jgi:hypothetical protein